MDERTTQRQDQDGRAGASPEAGEGFDAVPAIEAEVFASLLDKEWNVRRAAVNTIARGTRIDAFRSVAPEAALPLLIRALRAQERLVRRAAAVSIGAISTATRAKRLPGQPFFDCSVARAVQPTVPALILVLRDEDPVTRAAGAGALARIGPQARQALPALLGALNDESWEVRANAARAAAAVDPAAQEAVLPLLRMLSDDHPLVRDEVFRALSRMSPQDPDAALAQVLRDDGRGLHWAGTLALKKTVLCEPVGVLGTDSLDTPDHVLALTRALNDEDLLIRYFAARSLGYVGPAAQMAMPALIESLHHEDRNVRWAAVHALGSIVTSPDQLAFAALIRALEDPDPIVRTCATTSVGLMADLPPGTGPEDRARATRVAVPALIRTLQDDTRTVRQLGANALAWFGDGAREAVPHIIAARHGLHLGEEGVLWLLRKVASHPTWTDRDLLEFAPHFLMSLFWPEAVWRLRDFTFYRKVQLKQLSKVPLGGRPHDLLEEAAQEFAMRVLQDNTRRFLQAPAKYPELPGVIRNLARAAARALTKGQTDREGALRVFSSPEERLVRLPPAVPPEREGARGALHDLAARLQEHVFERMQGLQQRLVIEHFFKKSSRRELGEIFARPWDGLRRPLDRAQHELLQALQLPDRKALDMLATFVVEELLGGVVPDAVVFRRAP